MRNVFPAAAHVLEKVPLRLPFWRYFELYRALPHAFLLDSAGGSEALARVSFLGADPFVVFRARRRKVASNAPHHALVTIEERGGRAHEVLAEPLVELRRLMAEYAVDRSVYRECPAPLLAGAVGYLAYEAGTFIEHLPEPTASDLALPDIHLGLYDEVLAYCHETKTAYLSVLGRGPTEHEARETATRRRDALLERLLAFEGAPQEKAKAPRSTTLHIANKDAYGRLVERAKEHIFAGDVFELCLTHRIEAPFASDPWELYRALREKSPAPFASYLSLPEATIVSSSPERFLRLDASGLAESRPIKGTRPRSASAEEDARLRADLLASPKDAAENNMIVDLVRSDFGRVCKFGSVHVPELRVVESYATVHQLVSTIRGQLDESKTAIDLLAATFPGGSMTGAPKIEAMKILMGLERRTRGVYAGSIGYLDFSGTMDWSIVIRTAVVKDERAYFDVGGAIVADSEPHAEYQETLDKARALIGALEAVEGATE